MSAGQIDPLVHLQLAALDRLQPGQREQRRHQPLGALGGLPDDLAHPAQLVDVGVRIGQRDLELGADHRQRGAQLVAGVGHEQPLAVERSVEAGEHLVEGVRELAQLVVRAAEVDALVERLGGQCARGLGQLGDRAQRLLGEDVAADRPDDDDDAEDRSGRS